MSHIHQQFFGLLRWAVNGTPLTAVPTGEDWTVPTEDEWAALYRMAQEQSLTGLIFAAVAKLPAGQQIPIELLMDWMSDAEIIRGTNIQLDAEAARLTKLFADEGRRSAILKGQANALLYPDPQTRQPGDIDIWVEGGRESVIALLRRLGLVGDDPLKQVDRPSKATASYHHVHLPESEQGVVVEVHFRPSSGNYNPFTNYRLQRWLEQEIQKTANREGFNVPTMQFALLMQLAHIQRHFLPGGIGLRHVVDYFMLLRHASAEDRQVVAGLLRRFGLRHTAEALMWVLGKVLHLEPEQMLCKTDNWRGEWMLNKIMNDGNFGWYAPHHRQELGTWRWFFANRWRHIKMMRFDFWEMLWVELKYWKRFFELIPARIRFRTLSLRSIPNLNE